eukprot:Trichotokara_eunicae@DN8728_c0_g1_i1.p2
MGVEYSYPLPRLSSRLLCNGGPFSGGSTEEIIGSSPHGKENVFIGKRTTLGVFVIDENCGVLHGVSNSKQSPETQVLSPHLTGLMSNGPMKLDALLRSESFDRNSEEHLN